MTPGFVNYWEHEITKPEGPQYSFAQKMVELPKVVFSSGSSRGSVLCIPNRFSSSSCAAWILTPSSIGGMNRELATLRFPFTASETPFALCRKAPVTKKFLAQIRDRFVTQPEQGFWLRELFWSIGSVDKTTLESVDDLFHPGSTESVRIAITLIDGAPPELALDRPDFAVHVIEECGRVNAELGVRMESALVANTQKGHFNRTPGQPSPKYSSLKERSERLQGGFAAGSTGRRLFTRIHEAAAEMLKLERLDDEQVGFA